MTSDSSDDRRKPYHHGSLHAALVEASVALAREGGPDRVVLREAARVAGVSHSAAYRHFADREALLAEVSRYARRMLAGQMRQRIAQADDPVVRLGAVGAAYVEFALAQPGLFRAAFASHPAVPQNGLRGRAPDADDESPHAIVAQILDEVQASGLLAPQRRPGAEIAAWSAVHGLACLLLDEYLPSSRADVEFALNRVLDLIGRGLVSASTDASPGI